MSGQDKLELYYLIRDRNFGIYKKTEQEKIRKAKICVAGQGCVGELAAAVLARIGFGLIRIIDQDNLELSNLNRNSFAVYSKLGRPKTKNMLEFLNDATAKTVKIEVMNEMVNTKNAESAFKGINVIVQGIDNMYSRVIIHRVARKLGIPVVTMSGGPPYRAFVSTVLPKGIDYETMFNLPTKSLDLDIPSEELGKLHHKLRGKRVKYAITHGADKEWGKFYLSGERQTWAITPERAYITATLQAHETVNLVLGRPLMAKAPKIISIDLLDKKNIATVRSPKKGKYWDYKVW
ncbi:MAG: ThiF family adenylyltransferase [Candidatus ainarchaeum sp.]|nr:ThiF family adenylyltransferase [Candidatus ainarchaeum sp.]